MVNLAPVTSKTLAYMHYLLRSHEPQVNVLALKKLFLCANCCQQAVGSSEGWGSAPPTVTELFGSFVDTDESENSVILLRSSCRTTTALWNSTGLTFTKTKDLWRSVQHYANKALERWHGVVIFHNGIWAKPSVFSPSHIQLCALSIMEKRHIGY